MKYRNILIFLALLLLFSAAGCTKKAGDGPTPTPAADSGQSAFDLPAVALDEGWPEASVPTELPEYAEGTVVNSGEDGDTLYIKIRDTDEDELNDYLDKLKEAGWIVTGDSEEAEAVKDLYTADFTWQDGGAMLQMTLYTGEAGDWPSDKIPPDILQPQAGSLVGKIGILESMENAWYFNYTYDGMDEAGAQEYMELLRENGWSGDDTMVNKAFSWKDQNYNADIEIYETVETRTTFTCNFYIAD